MNIYFTAAVSQKNLYGTSYEKIVSLLKEQGHNVISDHIISANKKIIDSATEEDRQEYYKKVLKWISDSDVIVAEISFPSTLNVGHEISLALEKGKTVIGLYNIGKASLFFKGIKSDKFIYQEYDEESLKDVLLEALDFAQETSDTRFNFLISPSLLEYLDWIAKNRRIPRSVYLRRLIEADRDKNKDYNK
jgi:hypothetical protein